jgi:hypothetical protein
MHESTAKVALKVTAAVARIVAKNAPREMQHAAARGAASLQTAEWLTVFLFFIHGKDPELRAEAEQSLRQLPVTDLLSVTGDKNVHPQILDLIARFRYAELALMEPLLLNPAVAYRTLVELAGRCEGAVLSLIADNDKLLSAAPDIMNAIIANPKADNELKFRFGWQDPSVTVSRQQEQPPAPADDLAAVGEIEELEEENLSKYQLALEFGVADKIKFALTGDKEWRSIFLKDNNKLVCAAVMKNPRITEGEVLMVAKNRSANEELIRMINLNREWLKNYEIRKALVMNPRTPLPKALRYMASLTEKDVRELAKSKNVSQVIVNNARRMVMAKERKK